MNAYELADKLQLDKSRALIYVDTVVKSADMLRQQADRIEELEKAKTLTDEEIMECKAHVEVMYGCLAPLEFAWLILRKAQEK